MVITYDSFVQMTTFESFFTKVKKIKQANIF